jgi:hypothetical protein
VTDARKSQEQRILWLLEAAWPNWVPSPELCRVSLQYSSRIFSLRRKGWLIQNRVRIVGGVRHGEFRLGTVPVPSSKELRQRHEPPTVKAGTLFGDIAPDRTYRE